MADLTCDAGQIAISDMIIAINQNIEAIDYATSTIGGTVKIRLDESDPTDIKMYISIDGTDA